MKNCVGIGNLNTQGNLYYQQHAPQQISYNAFKKPVSIYKEAGGRVDFEYGPLQNRTYAYYGGSQTDKNQRQYHKHYSSILPVEMIEDTALGSVKIISYIGGDAYTAPIAHIKTAGGNHGTDAYHYLHRDYLGSILAISDDAGIVLEQRQFSAWGQVDGFEDSDGNTAFTHSALLGRGYTGHEHFFEVGLVHMNGRMYDAKLGRFLSPDNYIQDPFNSQSYNRYGYVWNNPLNNIDPSGEWKWLVSKVVDILTIVIVILAIVAAPVVYGSIVYVGGFSKALGTIAAIATAVTSYIVADYLISELNKYEEGLYEQNEIEDENTRHNSMKPMEEEWEQNIDKVEPSPDSEIFSLKHKKENYYLP